MEATGGTIYNIGSYRYHVFLSTDNFVVTEDGQYDILVIGPGSEGFYGGGGAGGYRKKIDIYLPLGIYVVALNYSDSVFDSSGFVSVYLANRGGHGQISDGNGTAGGSGGGAASFGHIGGIGNIGGFTPPEGNDGGDSVDNAEGGGGGFSEEGHPGVGFTGGDGGDGVSDPFLLDIFVSGWCCGGGGGAGHPYNGEGGRGSGKDCYGGGGTYGIDDGDGGVGIVVIRYLTTPENPITPEGTYGEGNHPDGFYNEGDEFRYAPGHEDPEGTALWDMTNSFGHPPITPTHFPGCGYWWKVDGVASGPTRSSVPYSNTSKKWLANKGNGSWEL
jgi:hypothetical protein